MFFLCFLYPFLFVLLFGAGVFNFWCECVQCLRGGVRFPNEVGVWWPSVYGEPNPKALHFQPWVGLGLLDRQALHYPHGSLAVRLKHKKNLPDAGFCLRYSIARGFVDSQVSLDKRSRIFL